MSQPISTRKYRWKWWHRVLRLISATFNLALLIFALYGIGVFGRYIFQNPTMGAWFLLIPSPLLLLIVYSQIVLLIAKIGDLVSTCVTISPDGLEIRTWPLYRVLLRWPGIEKALITHRFGRDTRLLNLETAEELPESDFTLWFLKVSKPLTRLLMAIPRYPFSLEVIQGYPHGDFADHLRQIAPKLFPVGEIFNN